MRCSEDEVLLLKVWRCSEDEVLMYKVWRCSEDEVLYVKSGGAVKMRCYV